MPGGNLQAARQLFFSLFGGDWQQGGQRGQGGGGGNGAARRGGGGGRIREGEWLCHCGLANRPYRAQCHACGRDRQECTGQPASAGKGSGASVAARAKGVGIRADGKGKGSEGEVRRWDGGGPVGADGRRPLLGGYASARTAPATGGQHAMGAKGQHKGIAGGKIGGDRGKGAVQSSVVDGGGLRSATSGGGPTTTCGTQDAPSRAKGAWAKPPCQTDSDGYTLVQPRRVWQQEGTAGKGGEGDKPPQCDAPQYTTRPRWSEEQSDDEMYVEDDLADADGDLDEHVEDAGSKDDPRRLRTRYESLARAVREWERRNPGDHDDPALLTLRQARDGAEEDWRRAKTPAPLPTRMGRAQGKLDKAGAALTRARQAVDNFDAWADSQRADLVRKMEEADRWYRWRQQQLDELHEEAGAKTCSKGAKSSEDLARGAAVSERLVGEILPAVQALLEHVQGNPEIEERLTSIAAGLQSAGEELDSARTGGAERYDLGKWDDWGAWDQLGAEGAVHDGESPMADDVDDRDGTKGGKVGWRSEGAGRWTRSRAGLGDSDPTAGLLDGRGTDHAAGSGRGKGPADATRQGDGAPASTGSGNKRGADEHAETKDAVRQKTEAEAREEADARRAAELLRQQQQAIAAQQASHEAGAGGFGSEAAQAVAAQQFVAEVCKAVARARKVGVEPKAGGKELVELSPAELKSWVDEHLGDETTWN